MDLYFRFIQSSYGNTVSVLTTQCVTAFMLNSSMVQMHKEENSLKMAIMLVQQTNDISCKYLSNEMLHESRQNVLHQYRVFVCFVCNIKWHLPYLRFPIENVCNIQSHEYDEVNSLR